MFSRRKFLTTSSLALAGTACATKGKEASATQDDSGVPAAGAALPPAIAALTSMKGTSTPISVDERKARLEKARRLMAEHKIDALLLTGGTSMVYFTGMTNNTLLDRCQQFIGGLKASDSQLLGEHGSKEV